MNECYGEIIMDTYIAYIESPLQAFNLIEFLDVKKISLEILIINKKTENSALNYNQIMNIVDMIKYKKLVVIDVEGTLKNSLKIKSALKGIGGGGINKNRVTLIAGEYRARVFWMLAGKFKKRSIVLLDDGTATLRINREEGISPRKIIKSLFLKSIGMVNNEFEKITFFSVYNIGEKVKKSDTVIRHCYENYKKKLASLPSDNNKVFIIGAPLFEAGVTSIDDIQLTLNMIKDLLKSKPESVFYYVPHRRERTEKIKIISELVKVKRLDFPFEVYPLMEKENVSSIAGFYSSLYDNLIMIYGDKIKITSYVINEANLSPEWKSFVGCIYDNYSRYNNANIELINKVL